MDLMQGAHAATAAVTPPSASSSSLAQKHPRPTDSDVDNPPAKKARQDGPREPFDLDQLNVVCINGTQTLATTILNMFAPATFTRGELRSPNQYQYDEFRSWLLEDAKIPREKPLLVNLPGRDGDDHTNLIHSRWSFGGLLGLIKNGSVTVPITSDSSPYITLQAYEPALPDAPPPPPEEAAADQPVQQAIMPAMPPATPPAGRANLEETREKVDDEVSRPQPPPARGPAEDDAAREGGAEDAPEAGEAQSDHSAADSTPQPVIDLTADENEAGVLGEEEDTTGLTSFDKSVFAKALLFFQTTEQADGKYTIMGIARPVHMYQLYALYSLFVRPVTTGVNGAMVGWDVGLGKTMLMLVYLHVRAHLAQLWKEVKAEWKGGARTAPRRHLPKYGQLPGNRCPRQGEHIVECPCVQTSCSRLICATYLTDSPAIIVIPSGLAHSWLREIRDTYTEKNGQAEDAKRLHIRTYVSRVQHNTSVPKHTNINGWKELVRETTGKVLRIEQMNEDDDESLYSLVESSAGTATDIFLVSSKSVQTLQKKYPRVDNHSQATCLTAGVFIFDEHHQYKGSTGGTDTIPFQALNILSTAARNPVTLFTLCGTTVEEGPSAWRGAVEHFHRQWEYFGREERANLHGASLWCGGGPLDAVTPDKFAAARRQYYELVRKIANKTRPDAQIGSEIRRLVSFFKPVMCCLRQGQRYRGQLLNPLPPCQEDYEHLEPVMDDTTGKAFRTLVGSVRKLVDVKLKHLLAEWEAGDKMEPRPTQQSVLEDLASGEQKLKREANTHFINLQRASMYPYIAFLQDNPKGDLDADAFAAVDCQAAADKWQKAMLNDVAIDDILRLISTWDFFNHLDLLEQNSAKYQHIKTLIKNMVTDKDEQTEPSDGSGKRHAILFHSQPISAIITYALLLRDPALRGVVKPLLLSARCSNEERGKIVEYMNEPCTAVSPNKVLIAIASVAAEGFNIQRANNVWFAELPVTLSKKEQAKGRAYRQGQKMKVNIAYLAEKGNLMEELGYSAMKAKETISRVVYGLQSLA